VKGVLYIFLLLISLSKRGTIVTIYTIENRYLQSDDAMLKKAVFPRNHIHKTTSNGASIFMIELAAFFARIVAKIDSQRERELSSWD